MPKKEQIGLSRADHQLRPNWRRGAVPFTSLYPGRFLRFFYVQFRLLILCSIAGTSFLGIIYTDGISNAAYNSIDTSGKQGYTYGMGMYSFQLETCRTQERMRNRQRFVYHWEMQPWRQTNATQS